MKHDWEYKKLGEVCDIINGKNQRNVESSDGEYPIMGSGGVMGYAKDYLCNAGTTIIGRKGTINRPIFVEEKFWNVDTAFGIQPKEGVSCKFIYYVCKSIDFTRYDKSVTIPSLVKSDLLKISIPIPPLPIQERIVAELDKVSEIIEKKKQQMKELDNLAQSIFYDMFGDPVENEKGWGTCLLEDLCDIGSSKRIFAEEYTETGIPFYRGKEISEKSKGYMTSVELYISPIRYNEIKCKYGVPKFGDILLTAVGTIGNIWVVDSDEPFYFKDGNVLWLQKKKEASSIYLKYLLENLIEVYKKSMANGCAYSALTIMNLRKMPTNIIPLPLQQAFAEKIEAIEKQKELINQSIKEAQLLFDSRMDYYFGE